MSVILDYKLNWKKHLDHISKDKEVLSIYRNTADRTFGLKQLLLSTGFI